LFQDIQMNTLLDLLTFLPGVFILMKELNQK